MSNVKSTSFVIMKSESGIMFDETVMVVEGTLTNDWNVYLTGEDEGLIGILLGIIGGPFFDGFLEPVTDLINALPVGVHRITAHIRKSQSGTFDPWSENLGGLYRLAGPVETEALWTLNEIDK